ncbi:hypothetical protein Tco_1219071 [Tanacetum coccineum]
MVQMKISLTNMNTKKLLMSDESTPKLNVQVTNPFQSDEQAMTSVQPNTGLGHNSMAPRHNGARPFSSSMSFSKFLFSVTLIASSSSKSSSTKGDALEGGGVSSNVTLSDSLIFVVCLLRTI